MLGRHDSYPGATAPSGGSTFWPQVVANCRLRWRPGVLINTNEADNAADSVFAGSVPELYDEYLVPLIFESYAHDLADRTFRLNPTRVLELAAGTGVVTRALSATLPPSVDLVASDLNQAMIERAEEIGTVGDVTWRQADALDLPFDDESFDVVVCQFGVMFFPDKVTAYREAKRVLRAGGTLLFNVWDQISTNEFADVVTDSVGTLFPADPPLFLARTPHGYHDESAISAELVAAGFGSIGFEPLEARSRAPLAQDPAIAYCQGTPLRDEIEARGGDLLEATSVAASAIAERFGDRDVDGRIRGYVLTAI